MPEGHCEGRRDKLINRPEAEAVVAQLHRLTQDPAYADRTMGVIILRQGDQTRLVQDLVDHRIDMPALERHNIQVGTPEEFQGDQRDVIRVSPGPRAGVRPGAHPSPGHCDRPAGPHRLATLATPRPWPARRRLPDPACAPASTPTGRSGRRECR
nr:AAA domain-containing protein [Streptomyces olivochromogenes]